MADNKPTYNELKKKLQEAEEILETFRSHKVDAVIGTDKIAVMRLKEVEDQLQEQIQISGNRLKEIESIYQNVPIGLCVLNTDLKFVRVNNHLAEMNGIPTEEHMGRRMSELLPELKGNIEDDLRHVIETGEPKMNVELSGETPARPGVERYWLEHWLPLYNNQGRVIGINMVINEITERKQHEKKLRQLNATLEERVEERTKVAEQRAEKLREMAMQMTEVEEKERQRLARVLHDGLQQLLIGAKFNTSHIKKQLSGQDGIKKELEELNQILDQSIEASRSLSYELSPPILHDQGLLAALNWLSEMPHMQNLTININADSDIPELSQNLKVFFFQAVRELLINIVKHADVDEAEIRVSGDEDHITIEVIDRGKGFDAAKMKFSDSKSQGLRNIREKLELMNGRLKINSEAGKGSHFTLQVPVDESQPSSSASLDSEKKGLDIIQTSTGKSAGSTSENPGSIDVLVVDDHQIMRDGLVKLLTKESDINIAGEASNGIEAVDSAHNLQPDVIIMDITMPKMDGIEATRRIHQEFPDIQVIGLSMHEENEYAIQMKKAGAMDLLNKGGPAEELFAAVRSVKW